MVPRQRQMRAARLYNRLMIPEIEAARVRAAELRQEAQTMLNGGLLALLERELGPVSIAGSVMLDLMVWPDIDLYVHLEASEAARMLELTPKLARELERQGYALAKTTLNNEHVLPDSNFPATPGLYGGFVFIHQASRRQWKLDLWGWGSAQYAEQQARHPELRRRLQSADRDLILRLKQADGYGKAFFSVDVYEFAIARAGDSLEAFQRFLTERQTRAEQG